MPLIRRGSTSTPQAGAPSLDSERSRLATGSQAERWAAARALGNDTTAASALVAALAAETAPEVREAIFTSLVLIRSPEAAAGLAGILRSDDAQMRTGALDALGAMPEMARPLLPGLLRGADPDVRLLSCDLVRGLEAEDGTNLLCDALGAEEHANVCGAAVDVLSELGTSTALPMLRQYAARFAGDTFLSFAIAEAIERVSQRPARDG